jgi:hypothetical protein
MSAMGDNKMRINQKNILAMKVKDILPRMKANRYTFRNLDQSTINYFQSNYNYLKRNEEREVCKIVETLINDYLNVEEVDYVVKIKAINFVSTNLI